jgi:CheY-like chemotaxis protein
MAHPTTTSAKGLRALVLDADAASLRSLAWSLEARFFSVCTARDGTRGLDLLLEELLSLDVLVIDAALPGRDALAFAELIRRGGERDLAIVVVTASATPELRAAALTLAVDAIVERREGPDAVALAAVAAVASRAAGTPSAPAPAPAREPEPELEHESAPARFTLPYVRGWSMLPA